MLLHSLIKCKATSTILLFLISFCLTDDVVIAKVENSDIFSQDLAKFFYSTSKENKYLLDGWNDYIIKVLGYSNAEHLKVIKEFSMDYAEAINALNEKYEKNMKVDEKNYSSKWLDELVNRFGKTFICNNRRIVMMNMIMAFNRRDAKEYNQAEKDVISKELILHLAYERYLNVFVQYYNQLNKQDQEKLKAWKEVAEKYLSIVSKSHFATVYYGMHMKDKIRENALKSDNEELYMFFESIKLPFGSGVSNKAERDLEMLVETCKMQGLKQQKDTEQ